MSKRNYSVALPAEGGATAEPAVDGEGRKRELIMALESARRFRVVDVKSDTVLQEGKESNASTLLIPLLKKLKNQRDCLRNSLRCSEATNRLLEQTVQTYEIKMLDIIAENGELHQRLEKQQADLFIAKTNVANIMRQRNELRDRLEEMLSEREIHRQALSAAEREMVYLQSRFQVSA